MQARQGPPSTAQCMKPVLGRQRRPRKHIWSWVFIRKIVREREDRKRTGASSSVHNSNHNAYIYETEASYDDKSSLKRCPTTSPLYSCLLDRNPNLTCDQPRGAEEDWDHHSPHTNIPALMHVSTVLIYHPIARRPTGPIHAICFTGTEVCRSINRGAWRGNFL